MTVDQARQAAAALVLVAAMAGSGAAELAAADADPVAQSAATVVRWYGEGAAALARCTVAEFAADVAQIVARLQGMAEALRLMREDPEPLACMQLHHRIDLAGAALREIFDDLLALGEPMLPMAEAINRSVTMEELKKRENDRQQWLAHHKRPDATAKTSTFCQPWCRDGDPRSCGGICLSEGEIIVASADGGRFADNGMRYPLVEVYGSYTYPDRIPAVHLLPAGPYAAKGEIQGWLEFRPEEARKVAKALVAEADRMTSGMPVG